MSRVGLFVWILAGLFLTLQGCLTSVSDLHGTYINDSVSLQVDQKTVDEIVGGFKQFEEALQRRDLDGVMAL